MFNKLKKIFKKEANTENDDLPKDLKDMIKQNRNDEKKDRIKSDRNIRGKALEKEGKTDEAIELYEENVTERFDGNYPYDRLAIIYRKKKLYNEEKRVLETAINVFEEDVLKERGDREVKLNKFKDRLNKVNEKYL